MLLQVLLSLTMWFMLMLLTSTGALAEYDKPLCVSPNNVFHAQVNIFAGELGYYVFEECGLDVINPTIAMELGETYTFFQVHRTNHFHPIGFAYSPYGDEDFKKEVNPSTSKGNQACVTNQTCDAPMYFLNNDYLGQYSNNPAVKRVTTNVTDIGLEVYASLFIRNIHEWSRFGNFSIQFTITDPEIATDMFIFCHIHEWMAGRVKVTKNGKVINELDVPTLGFEYDYNTPLMSDFDRDCGTFGLGPFQTPGNSHCPDYFVCDKDDPSVTPEMAKFSTCIDAMNCHMLGGMTTGIKAHDERALFIHQMIPHHQNAVNMAKALIKAGKTKCDDMANDEEPDCILEGILYTIVNDQNMQIQQMYDYLDAKRFPESDNCDIKLETVLDDDDAGSESAAWSSPYHWSNVWLCNTNSTVLLTIVMSAVLLVLSHA